MATQPVSADYSAITTIGTVGNPCATTAELFDCEYAEQAESAIDLYIGNCRDINKIWAHQKNIAPEFGRLLLLGYVSAIESFFRTMLRSIINTDAKAQSDAHAYVVPFGAVLYHHSSTIAEALLEGISFAGQKEVKAAFLKFLVIRNFPDDISAMFIEYEKICQLRHCCVHRFGKLGVQNGIALGLEEHGKALEKPVTLDKQKLEDVASWLMSFAKTINNHLFRTLLDRSLCFDNPHRTAWSWSYSRDRGKFLRIYRLFATTRDSAPSPGAKELYLRFRSVAQLRERKAR